MKAVQIHRWAHLSAHWTLPWSSREPLRIHQHIIHEALGASVNMVTCVHASATKLGNHTHTHRDNTSDDSCDERMKNGMQLDVRVTCDRRADRHEKVHHSRITLIHSAKKSTIQTLPQIFNKDISCDGHHKTAHPVKQTSGYETRPPVFCITKQHKMWGCLTTDLPDGR
jgi:hypothetical protein